MAQVDDFCLHPSEIGIAMRNLVTNPPLEKLLTMTLPPDYPFVTILGLELDERLGIPQVTIDRLGERTICKKHHRDLFEILCRPDSSISEENGQLYIQNFVRTFSVELNPVLIRAIDALIRHQQQTP